MLGDHLLGLPGSLEEGQHSVLGTRVGLLALWSGCAGGISIWGKKPQAFLTPSH